MDAVREDVAVVDVTKEDAEDRTTIMESESPLWRSLMREAERRRVIITI